MHAIQEKLILLGLDAADKDLVMRWARDGSLPNFQQLLTQSAWAQTANPTGMVAGTVWPTFYTGVLAGRTGRFRGTTQFVNGTYEHADIDFETHAFPTFWDALGAAGVPATVVDAPYAFLSSQQGVTQIVDWCSHSAWKDGTTQSSPRSLGGEIRARYGSDPVGKCDFAPLDTLEDYERFRDGLLKRIEQKLAYTLDRLSADEPGLLMNVLSECHCAGHQLWHLHDPQHPAHDAELARRLGGNPMKDIYLATDAALGRLLESAGDDVPVMVFCSHGIGPAYTGTHLLDEILMRIEGISSPRRRQSLAGAMVATWTVLPQWFRTSFTPLQKLLWPKLKANLVQPGKARRRYFEIILNDATGGIRLNVKGREPQGIVEPGDEYDEICAMLTEKLMAVTNRETGQPLVKQIIKTRERFPGPQAARLPDLMVEWSRVGPIGAAYSPDIGDITHKFVFRNHRTGDHTEDDGLIFLRGAGITPGQLAGVSVEDLPSTIAALFGVDLPDTDGNLIEGLLPVAAAAQSGAGG